MLLPKPTRTRRQERRAEKDHQHAVILAVRRQLIKRDQRCRVCGELLSKDAQMHEMVFRSQLRGRPPEEIFNTRNCLMLCLSCHADVHARKIDIIPVDDDLGANGDVEVQRRFE
jgi:5-methylcytosine-specific restriction endonuclease McrA